MSTSYNEPTTKLTYKEYVLFPSDGMRHEIIHGRHYMNPAPSPKHQTVSRRIQFQLYQQIELTDLGQVFDAPIDLQLHDTDVVQPDLVVVLKDKHIITPTKIKGVPDLVVEILSPSNRKYDQELKKQLYQQHGIPEYWIVDHDDQSIEQNRLGDSAEYTAEKCTNEIRFEKTGAVVDLSLVWK